MLQGELARLEDLLAHSRADRDELAIKYGAISERVRQGTRTTTTTTTVATAGINSKIGRAALKCEIGTVSLEVFDKKTKLRVMLDITGNNIPL